MSVQYVNSSSYANLGNTSDRNDNEMVAIDGLVLLTDNFANNAATMALEDTWIAGVRSKDVFPLINLDSYEDQSSDDTIYEASSGRRKLLKRGKKRYMFQFDIPLAVHKKLHQSFNNANLRYAVIRDGRICLYNDGGTLKGFKTSMINIGSMKEVPADGSTPGFTPIYLDMDNYREWDMYGDFFQPSWEPNDLEPLHDVIIEVQGTPTDSEVILKVYSNGGIDADGAVKERLVKGIEEADWSTGFGTATAYTDNGDGTYTFTSSAAFSTGSANLVDPTAMVSEGLLIQSTGAATVTI